MLVLRLLVANKTQTQRETKMALQRLDMKTEEAYQRGLKQGQDSTLITIATNNVWGARTKDGASVSSYEKIGYHAGTEELLRGFWNSDCPIRVYYSTSSSYGSFEFSKETHTWEDLRSYVMNRAL